MIDTEAFSTKGFVGPCRCLPREQMLGLFGPLHELAQQPSPLFEHADVDKHRRTRNRHLDSALVLDLACNSAIIDAVAATLGPDLILWRSDFFIQGQTDPETVWHQDRQFSGPRRLPSLVLAESDGKPSTRQYTEDEMRGHIPIPKNVSVWLAIGDTNRDTGCLMVVEGSNTGGVIGTRPARPGEKPIFGKGTVLDYEVPGDRIRYMELEAGEFIIFDRLTLHASMPTGSTTPRIGLSMRYTTPDVYIYPGYTVDGQGFSVEPYRALVVRGEDRFGRNQPLLESPERRRQTISTLRPA